MSVTPGPAKPRPADPATGYAPEYVEVATGMWAVVVFALIPKNGFAHTHFPHYWGGPQESMCWRVERHGSSVPDGTFVFTSRAEAVDVVAEAFGDHAEGIYRYMSRVEVPSDDHRRAVATGSNPGGAP